MDDVEFTAFGFGHVGGSLQDVGVKPVALDLAISSGKACEDALRTSLHGVGPAQHTERKEFQTCDEVFSSLRVPVLRPKCSP